MKALINKFLIALLLGLSISCNAQVEKRHPAKKTTLKPDKKESISDAAFISKIQKLKIVMDKEKEVKSESLDYFLKDTPTVQNPYYIIQAGKSNEYRLEIFFNFYCYPKTGEIKLYDPIKDSLINIQR